jgi:flagellar protein FliL
MSEQKSNPEEKKSSKKLILIILAVLLLIGGAGAGYYFFMRHPDDNKAQKEGEKDDKQHSGQEVEAKHEEEPEEGEGVKVATYIDMSQPIMVNFPKGSGVTLVQVSLSFLADSEETAAAIKKHEPMVRNNLMMKINAQTPAELRTKEGKDALRIVLLEEINSILDKMAHGKHVKEVFYTTFVMQ